jgi:hypothetical protein
MVSNALKMKLQELLDTLKRLRQEFGKSSEYQAWRRQLPKDWPI